MVVCYIAIAFVTNRWIASLLYAGFLGVLHIVTDTIKVKRDLKKSKREYMSFLLDQMVHFVLIVLSCIVFEIPWKVESYYIYRFLENIELAGGMAIVIASLICWKPAAIFVALVFKDIPITIENADSEECPQETEEEKHKGRKRKNSKQKDKKKEPEEQEIAKIGSWIGILEREIILLLGLLGQYGAIGFVLTAKSLARYKQLEKKAFAEKYLVGTLLSCFVAFLCVAMCKMFI